MQECQQEHHESTAERDSHCYKECLCGAADIVCPNVLRNKSGKGRHEAHGYQRKENKKFFCDANAGGSNNAQRVEDGCNDQKGYRYLKILRGNGQTQRNDSADSAFLPEVRKFQAEGQAMLFGVFHINNGEEKAACLCNDRCQCRTCCGHVEQPNKNKVQNDINGTGNQYKQKWRSGVAHTTENAADRVISGDENHTRSTNANVSLSLIHIFIDDLGNAVFSPRGQNLDDTYVVFDIETTGLSKEKEMITEIGAVKVADGKIIDRFSTFVNPQRPISAEITKLTGITDDIDVYKRQPLYRSSEPVQSYDW